MGKQKAVIIRLSGLVTEPSDRVLSITPEARPAPATALTPQGAAVAC